MIDKLKYLVIALFLLFLVLIFIILLTQAKYDQEAIGMQVESMESEEVKDQEESSFEVEKTEVLYNEGNADHYYNYIVNAHFIEEHCPDYPFALYVNIGDRLNDFLQDNGYKGRKLTCTKAINENDSNYISLWFDISDENDKQLYVNYLYTIDNWKEIQLIDK